MARIYDDVTQTIGNTPLVRVRKLIRSQATVLAKLEGQNPMASVKDRIGLAMIEAGERDGKIGPGVGAPVADEGHDARLKGLRRFGDCCRCLCHLALPVRTRDSRFEIREAAPRKRGA